LGWVERALFWLVWFLFHTDFITFIGIWLALKVVGDFKSWHGEHANRAKFISFVIGTSLSIISVILICFFTELFISKILASSHKVLYRF
jgi:hypothetical protein